MKSAQIKISEKGFTLIELLVVVAIIAALAVAVFVALNPAQRLKDTRIARRTTDVDTILTAIHTYIVDKKGTYPGGITVSTGSPYTIHQIGLTGNTCGVSDATSACNGAPAACLDLHTDLSSYLKSMPIDPLGSTTYDDTKTGYAVDVTDTGIVTVTSCAPENGTTKITASR